MPQPIESSHRSDDNGNPQGGYTVSTGLSISWQDGPLGRGKERREPNGAFVETVIFAAIDRLNYYQDSKFRCDENYQALLYLQAALACLELRSKKREDRKVEGLHEP